MTRAERWASIDAILYPTLLMDNKAAHRYITERARYRVLQKALRRTWGTHPSMAYRHIWSRRACLRAEYHTQPVSGQVT